MRARVRMLDGFVIVVVVMGMLRRWQDASREEKRQKEIKVWGILRRRYQSTYGWHIRLEMGLWRIST